MTNTLILLLLVVLTAASFYAIWLQRQRSVAPDSSGEAERISELERALREAELEVARLQERLQNLEGQKAQLSQEFKLVAHEALQAQTEALQKQMKEANSAQLSVILAPFREKLDLFGQRVQDTHEKGQRERIELKTEVTKLVEQNEKLKNEANQLTKALRGDVKMQGNWGEMVLERLLERTGLTKGQEYSVQESITTEDGKRYQPDVVLHLPENKHIIVDSKVSLVAYERFVNADSPEEQAVALKEHITSIKNHIRGLSEKNYQNLYGVSLDFVILFVPIEGAYSVALQAEPSLYQEAFDKNIALVSATSLWSTLRTVGTLWRQERQNANVQEIIRQASDLYDKFVGFSEELIKVGSQMDTAKRSYENSMKMLVEGKGNLVRRTENLRVLGLKNSKSVHPNLVDRAMDAASSEEESSDTPS
ncbi:MAG: DNA recombination protein RmuC [Flavobacteriia bacterium]|jgi:DNA recombination protein RmuC|nr:DNA recombination protein RmuC [Flavobacteriia bacterium]NDH90660.1 DNA recombination protein RmuC [Flavobacteriia bacterium]